MAKLPWFKLYIEIMDDPKLSYFTGDQFRILIYLMCLARESDEPGLIKLTPTEIAWRVRRPIEEVEDTIKICQQGAKPIIKLVDDGMILVKFLERQYEKPSDTPQATRERKQKQRDKEKCHADVTPSHAIDTDTDTDQDTDKEVDQKKDLGEQPTRAKTLNQSFDEFWKVYPKKRSKGQAEKTWSKIKPDEQLLTVIIDALKRAKTSVEWTKEGGNFIPHPATWLNAKGWEDEYQAGGQVPEGWHGLKKWAMKEGVVFDGG
jgi:hypothetical protein